jgi:outer membrane protein TolC
MMVRWFLIVFFTVFLSDIEAQVLPFNAYIELVKTNHPLARQARLQTDLGRANQLMASGGFDPKIEASHDHKSFDGKNYYRITNTQLKVPTWFGVEVKGGYERTDGQFLDNSNFLPARGLWNFGLSVPLGKGLIIDERRAALKQAEIFMAATEQQRKVMLNQLLYESTVSYLNWQQAHQRLDIVRQGLQLASERLGNTISGFENGDLPAIDTLESFIALQTRQQMMLDARRDLANARADLELFLWSDGFIPLEMEESTIPDSFDIQFVRDKTNQLMVNEGLLIGGHPEILSYLYKIDMLNVENRLNKEAIKPDLRISYQPLIAATSEQLFAPLNTNNYKLGASFQYPIFTRKERGKVQMTDLKIQEADLAMSNKRQSIQTKLMAYRQNINLLEEQVPLVANTVANYNRMLLAEKRKFTIGESSIFLVNSRENKYLESQTKLIDTQIKLIKNRMTYLLLTGKLDEVL